MSDWNPRVNEIFLNALAKGHDYHAYLDTACRSDTDLRRAVEIMLAAHEQAGSFLERPALALTATDNLPPLPVEAISESESAGNRLGPYQLLQKLGEGGMGTVWLASQEEPVRRQVALKIIRSGMDSRQVLTRFAHERHALSLMDHPNIARVLDAGVTANCRPYFVMELVQGVPLLEFCDQAGLTITQRLELFIPICQAVQHAHQKGIIHRDLKPANVLIATYDGKPQPKVIDFGIAKLTLADNPDETMLTSEGMLVGTLEYMAPEQVDTNNLDIDTRVDIYALGVMLYELVTGTVPFSAAALLKGGIGELIRVIHHVEPPRPSARLEDSKDLVEVAARRRVEPARLVKGVRGDLDWIVMKCLEKERDRRYATATGVAQDIGRHLRDEPITAGRPSMVYRWRKFVRRHSRAVTATALLLLVLIGGIVGTTVGLIQAEQAREQADLQRHNAEQAQERGQQRRVEAEKARDDKDEALKRATANELLARQASEAEGQAKAEAQKRAQQLEKAGDILLSIFQSLNPRLEAQGGPPLAAQLAEQLDKAAVLLEGDAVGDPTNVAKLQITLGQTLISLGFPQKAVDVLEKCRHTLESQAGPGHPSTLMCCNTLALAYLDAGNRPNALSLWEQMQPAMDRVYPPDNVDRLTFMGNLANAYVVDGQRNKGMLMFKETLDAMKAKLPPDHPALLLVMNNLATAHLTGKQPADALPLLKESLARMQEQYAEHHPDVLMTMTNLAAAYVATDQHVEAVPLLQTVLKWRKAKLGANHPSTLNSVGNLGVAYVKVKRHGEAAELFEEWLANQRAKLPSNDLTLASILSLLSECRLAQKQYERAESSLREVLAIYDNRNLPGVASFGAENMLGAALAGQKKYDEAEPLLTKSAKILVQGFSKFGPADRAIVLAAVQRVIDYYDLRKMPDESERWRNELQKLTGQK